MSELQDASILVTGGTGSFGKAFIRHALDHLHPRRIVVLSRDELKQSEMRPSFPDEHIRWFLGDIRDRDRLMRAFHGVDYVIHAAALKQVDTAEYNPFEFVKTNVLGSQNVIDAAIDSGVKKVVALSTDKASSPINLYGATKLTADKLFVAANNYSKAMGDVLVRRSVRQRHGQPGLGDPVVQEAGRRGQAAARHRRPDDPVLDHAAAGRPVRRRLLRADAGRRAVRAAHSRACAITDLVEAMAPGAETYEIGIRPGEKLHEEMISSDDSYRTIRQEERYVVKPTVQEWWFSEPEGEPVPPGFSYRSDTNDLWLTKDELRRSPTA